MGWNQTFSDQMYAIENELLRINYPQLAARFYELAQYAKSPVQLMIVGEFDAGKSTFINALLGEKVLTMSVTPTTATVTKVTYGKKRRLIAYFKSGQSKEYELEWLNSLSIEEEIMGKDAREDLAHIEIQLPIAWLKQIEIIDSPGLNSIYDHHTQMTESFFDKIDYCFWIFAYPTVGTASELEMIEELRNRSVELKGIVNKVDRHDEEEDSLEDFLRDTAKKSTMRKYFDRLIGVSARLALQASTEENPSKLRQSNWGEIDILIADIKKVGEKKKADRLFEKLNILLAELVGLLKKEKTETSYRKVSQICSMLIRQDYPHLIELHHEFLLADSQALELKRQWEHAIGDQPTYSIPEVNRLMEKVREILGPRYSLKLSAQEFWENVCLSQYQSIMEKVAGFEASCRVMEHERKRLENEWDLLKGKKLARRSELQALADRREIYSIEYDNLTREAQDIGDAVYMLEVRRAETQEKLEQEISAQVKLIDKKASLLKKNVLEYMEKSEERLAEIDNQKTYSRILQWNKTVLGLFDIVSDLTIQAERWPIIPTRLEACFEEAKKIADMQNDLDFEDVQKLRELLNKRRALDNFVPQALFLHTMIRPLEFQNIMLPELKLPNFTEQEIEDKVSKQKGTIWGLAGAAGVVALLGITLGWQGYTDTIEVNAAPFPAHEQSYAEPSPQISEARSAVEIRSEEESSVTEEADEVAQLDKIVEITPPTLEQANQFLKQVREEWNAGTGKRLFSSEGILGMERFANVLENSRRLTAQPIDLEPANDGTDAYVFYAMEIYEDEYAKNEYKVSYTLMQTQEADSAKESFLVTDVQFTATQKTVLEIPANDADIRNFLEAYRSDYFSALNDSDFDRVAPHLTADSAAYNELETYISQISGRGYDFSNETFTVEKISKTAVNRYQAVTTEQFVFTGEEGSETRYERKKRYTLRTVQPGIFSIDKIDIISTVKTKIVHPTVQLVDQDGLKNFLSVYYTDFVDAFNGRGFDWVSMYYDPQGPQWSAEKTYLANAIDKQMQMTNLDFEVVNVYPINDHEYKAELRLRDRYQYRDGTGDEKVVSALYRIVITPESSPLIRELVSINILEKTEF